MRPKILNPLFQPINTIKGVGDRYAALIESMAGHHIIDLLFHLPNRVIERTSVTNLSAAEPGQQIILPVEVISHKPPPRGRRQIPYRVHCLDQKGTAVDLVFFRAHEKYLKEHLPEGKTRYVCGKLDIYRDKYQITHPDHIANDNSRIETHESVYPITAGLSARALTKIINNAQNHVQALPEWLDPTLKKQNSWPDWDQAIRLVHEAPGPGPSLDRLAYDELLANQLALSLVRRHRVQKKGHVITGEGHLRKKILENLPFTLTQSQAHALEEVYKDMSTPHRMMRLLQGDVGSGKTVVALLGMAAAVEAGFQAAMIAPTEILARQHMEGIAQILQGTGINVVCLTGRDKGEQRHRLLKFIADGTAHIVLGTHAVFQETVDFYRLGLVVIDEQHRFGVHQRLSLSGKGKSPDMLVMTATPIPRTLLLATYGDMATSQLIDKPPGRLPIDTRLVNLDRLDETTQSIKRAIQAGQRVYWVCPLVEESELVDLAAAEDRHVHLKQVLGKQVGLIHGRLKDAEKDAAMQNFIEGRTKVLVATTVIEVGVNVPQATIMVIEHAERFGLSQLHQLRGRVGRGADQSTCLLLYKAPLGEVAQKRLSIMRETEDGFKIAEVDLQLRGGGEALGTRQSGLPDFRIANLAQHAPLLATAHDDVRLILNKDPDLKTKRGAALRSLLYLFQRDHAVQYLESG